MGNTRGFFLACLPVNSLSIHNISDWPDSLTHIQKQANTSEILKFKKIFLLSLTNIYEHTLCVNDLTYTTDMREEDAVREERQAAKKAKMKEKEEKIFIVLDAVTREAMMMISLAPLRSARPAAARLFLFM